MSACGPAAGRTLSKGYLSESPELVAAPALAGSGAGLASACVARGRLGGRLGGPASRPAAAASAGGVAGPASRPPASRRRRGLEAAGFEAAGRRARFAAGFGRPRRLGFAAAFGFAAALGFAAAFGFAGALGLVGASAAAFDAAEAGFPAAFGFELGAAVPVGFAVADFGAPFAPALGAGFRFFAAGLRVEAPALAARAVRVVPGVEAPVLLPPARVPAGVSEVCGVRRVVRVIALEEAGCLRGDLAPAIDDAGNDVLG